MNEIEQIKKKARIANEIVARPGAWNSPFPPALHNCNRFRETVSAFTWSLSVSFRVFRGQTPGFPFREVSRV
jgi:hypothetical protein